jgi:hypothetical protein
MLAVKLTRCDSYTLVPTLFVRGKVYHVSDEIGKDLLSKQDEYGINYFEAVDLNSSSNEEKAEESAQEEEATANSKKSGAKVTI